MKHKISIAATTKIDVSDGESETLEEKRKKQKKNHL